MPTNYDGVPSAITFPSRLVVGTVSNTNPMVVTTVSPLPASFFLTGLTGAAKPRVHIWDVHGNLAANGIWDVTPTGANTFTIPAAGSGAYAGFGYVQPLNAQALYTVPVDGDADNQASIAAWAEATGDRTQFLTAQVGAYKLAGITSIQYLDTTNAAWAHIAANLTSGTAVQWVADNVVWNGFTSGQTPVVTPVAASPAVFQIGDLVLGDFLDIELVTTLAAGAAGRAILQAATVGPGVTPAWPANYASIGASQELDATRTTGLVLRGAVSSAAFGGASNTGSLFLTPVFLPRTSGVQSHTLAGDTTLSVRVWRPTGVPQ